MGERLLMCQRLAHFYGMITALIVLGEIFLKIGCNSLKKRRVPLGLFLMQIKVLGHVP